MSMSDFPGQDQPPVDPPYQSLYRRFRPQRFADVRGQEHVTRVLRNSVRDGRVAHSYLFSGPRGTGKTSTARILAMALNCEHPVDGEPDGTCGSCVEIRRGVSADVQELDAASNRRLDEIRDLLSRVAWGARGRRKVYIIDEVHQLTPDASSALLKTLEEPPGHVVFVLATTDPQKVLDTIRSRTIHFEFHLLPAEVLVELVRDINQQAQLDVASEALDQVVRRGHGSARDTLTVLDQVAAGGGDEDSADGVSAVVDGIAERDTPATLTAVAQAITAGGDARRLAADLVEHLRNAFLANVAPHLVLLGDNAIASLEAQSRRLGLAALVRAMEVLGQALAEMRDSVDPRITLEVALVRLSRPDADVSPAALLERIERLERAGRGEHHPGVVDGAEGAKGRATHGATGSPVANQGSSLPPPPPTPPRSGPPAPAVPQAPAPTRSGPPLPGPVDPGSKPAQPAGSPPTEGRLPSRDELTKAWGDGVLATLSGRAKGYLGSGRFVRVDPDAVVFALPNQGVVARCQDLRPEAEAALAARFGRPVPLKLVAETALSAPTPSSPEPMDEVLSRHDLEELPDADAAVISPEQRLLEMFPGAEEVSS